MGRCDAEALTPKTLRAPRKRSTLIHACSGAERADDLESGDHHEAVVSKISIAGESGTAVPFLPPPALELAVPLIETNFERALRAVDNRVQGFHEFGPVPRDDDETTLHSAVPQRKREQEVDPQPATNCDTLRQRRGEGKHKRRCRLTRRRASQAAEQGPSPALALSHARCGAPGVGLTRPCARHLEAGPF